MRRKRAVSTRATSPDAPAAAGADEGAGADPAAGARVGAAPARGSWLVRLEDRLKHVYGPADIAPVGRQPERSTDRLAGSGSAYAIHRDSSGTTYLVAAPAERAGGPGPSRRGDAPPPDDAPPPGAPGR